MRTEIVFFDSKEQSIQGTIRGLFAIAVILAISILWYVFVARKLYSEFRVRNGWISVIAVIIFVVLFASAIAVAQPMSAEVAAVYGALVGLVVFGACNAVFVIVSKYSLPTAVIDTCFGAGLGALTAYLTFLVFRDRYPV